MAGLVAGCGLDCGACEAYLATQANDMVKAKAVAEKWGKQYGDGTPFPIEATFCDGCLTPSPRKGGFCGQCPIRACVIERKVATCAHCPDYGCAKLEEFLKMAPQLRETLERIRRDT
jgi:hypothetical protein